jgi:hypothetical protein
MNIINSILERVKSRGYFKKYRVMLSEAIGDMADYDEMANIFFKLDIPKNHYYNVTNEFRQNEASDKKKEHPYYIPLEYIIKTTIGTPEESERKYSMIKEICHDCGCKCMTPGDQAELKAVLQEHAPDPLKVMRILQRLVGEQ